MRDDAVEEREDAVPYSLPFPTGPFMESSGTLR